MSRKVFLLFCIGLAHAGILGPEYYPATAVSYSSIRFGTAIKNSAPFENAAAPYDSLLTEEGKLKTLHKNQHRFQTLDMPNRNIKEYVSSFNDYQTAPTYTERSIVPQYVPSRARILNLAKPILASRNIPQAPSPDFDSVPSVLKTEGLSAYASFPIKVSDPEIYAAPKKGLTSPKSYVIPTHAYKDVPVRPGYLGSLEEKREGISSLSLSSRNQAQPLKVSYSEIPVVSHVSVISSGTNYSW